MGECSMGGLEGSTGKYARANWTKTNIPGMIKNPRSAIGTVIIPSTMKSPIRKE